MTTVFLRPAALLVVGLALVGASPDRRDETLLFQQLHAIDQAEIQAGKMAEQRGRMQDIRTFGRMLVDDHTAAERQLAQLAKADSVPLSPKKAGPALRMLQGDLDKASGELMQVSPQNFDYRFAQTMRDQHRQAIRLVREAESRFQQSPPIERLLSNVLPQLQRHENMANDILGRGVAH